MHPDIHASLGPPESLDYRFGWKHVLDGGANPPMARGERAACCKV